MKRALIALSAAWAAGVAVESWACDACDEDKIAATYDHAVIDAATTRHNQVVFVAVDGPVNIEKITARIAAAANRIRGVQKGTLRTSASPPAFSFALDATRSLQSAVAGFRSALNAPQARLTLVRIMRDGELIDPR